MASTIAQDIVQIQALAANGIPLDKLIPQLLEMFTKIKTKGVGVRQYTLTAPDAPTTLGKATQVDLLGLTQVDCPVTLDGLVQPDYPRNIVYNGTQLTGATALTLVTVGIDAKGAAATETVQLTTATPDVIGDVAFMSVTSIKITAISEEGVGGDLVDIGHGVKFGLPFDLLASTDIIKTNMDNDDVAVAGHTISATYQTISFATAPNATRVFDMWVKDNN